MTNVHVVHGPPGCGKTTYLARQVARAAQKYGRHAVAVGSLTKAAAIEVAGRDTGLPKENIGTLHAHAYRALGRPKLAETPEGLSAWNSWVRLPNLRIASKHSIDPENAQPEATIGMSSLGEKLLNRMAVLRARQVPKAGWGGRVAEFAEHWERFKQQTDRLDFTDLIEEALEHVDAMPCHPTVMMLDEAQDLSKLEMALAYKWARECHELVVVGDSDQGLYRWRGSDPVAFMSGEVASVHTLSRSFRVPAVVHRTAVQWIRQIGDRPEVVYEPRDSRGEVHFLPLCVDEPRALVRHVRADLDEGATVMVLASCGYMLIPLLTQLRAEGVPFANPYRPTHGAWNPLRGASRLLAFLRPDAATWDDETRMWTWDDVRRWIEPIEAKGTLRRGAKAWVEARCHEDRFGESRADEPVELGLLLEMFHDDHKEPVYAMDTGWWHSRLRAKDHKRQVYPMRVAEINGPQALRDAPKLCVGTIHSVKGGEADVVYLMPDLSTAGFDEWRQPGPGHDDIVRMFYVGMTRAREKLVLGMASGMSVQW